MRAELEAEKRLFNRKLEALAKKDYIPEGLLELLTAITQRQFEILSQTEQPVISEEYLTPLDLRVQGKPLLDRTLFPYDANTARDLFLEFLSYPAKSNAGLKNSFDMISQAVEKKELDVISALDAYMHKDETFLSLWRSRLTDSPRALDFLLRAGLYPSIEATARSLSAYVPTEWELGHCPICGESPYIGYLLGKEGFRRLTCSFCSTDYPFRRLRCPYCEESDQKKLAIFMVDEDPGIKIEVCNRCMHYIKTADFRNFDREFIPSLDDLDSMPLDILATKRGYKRPVLSAWGF